MRMTRINVGIDPEELCDQHLLAEYRELPRLWDFKPKSKPPEHFKLGPGHVLWCSQFKGMLADRFTMIVSEMRARGMTVNYPDHPPGAEVGARPSDEEIARAAPIVRQRISERLDSMKTKPRWTKRV